jgi:hypothetical protein
VAPQREARRRQALDPPLGIEADLVIDHEIVALAGLHHVVVAVGTELGRAPGVMGHERGGGGIERGLRLLAAKGPAHAPHLDRHIGRRAPEQVRHEMLHLARVLGRRQQMDLAILHRTGQRDLPFEVEMVLPAHGQLAAQAMRRCPRA